MINKFVLNLLVLLTAGIAASAAAVYTVEGILRWQKRRVVGNLSHTSQNLELTWGKPVHLNSYGFREREFPKGTTEGVIRVIVLGDSITWGPGLSESKRYTNLTEELLNNRYPDQRFEVLNFGLVGGPTVHEAKILTKYFDLAAPNLIVVGFCLNDPQPREQNYSPERSNFRRKHKKLVLSHLMLERYGLRELSLIWRDSVYRFAELFGLIPSWEISLGRSYDKNSDDWKGFVTALKQIKNTSDTAQLPAPVFSILNQGTYTTKPTDYRHPGYYLQLYLKWYDQAQATAEELGFMVVRHDREIISKLSNTILGVNRYDSHPSAGLHRIYAEKLFKVISKLYENGRFNTNSSSTSYRSSRNAKTRK